MSAIVERPRPRIIQHLAMACPGACAAQLLEGRLQPGCGALLRINLNAKLACCCNRNRSDRADQDLLHYTTKDCIS
jgi:hypothetical protein